jgi:hypothetical protein
MLLCKASLAIRVDDEGEPQSVVVTLGGRAVAEVTVAQLRTVLEQIEEIESPNQMSEINHWPDPTQEMLDRPDFMAIWKCIKSWDIHVPGVYEGYCGATGNHVRAILDALEEE